MIYKNETFFRRRAVINWFEKKCFKNGESRGNFIIEPDHKYLGFKIILSRITLKPSIIISRVIKESPKN